MVEGLDRALNIKGRPECHPHGHRLRAELVEAGTDCWCCRARATEPEVGIRSTMRGCFTTCARKEGCATADVLDAFAALRAKYIGERDNVD